MSNKTLVLTALVTLAITFNFETASAQNQPLTYSPNPIIYGQATTYKVPNTGNAISSVAWSTQMIGSCGATFTYSSYTSSQLSVFETIPGTFTVYAYVKYQGNSGGNTPPPQTFQVTVTVPPPDGVTLVMNNVVATMGTQTSTKFQVTCKGQPVGHLPSNALAQECNFNFRYSNGVNIFGFSNQWDPLSLQDPNFKFFKLENTIINDIRTIGFASGTNAYNISYSTQQNYLPWMSCTQKLRIMLPDGCGGFTPWPLGQGTTCLMKQPNNGYSVDFRQ